MRRSNKFLKGRDTEMRSYAKRLGYRTLADAIFEIGREDFIRQFEKAPKPEPKKKSPKPKPMGRKPKYPFSKMKPGDSLIIDTSYSRELMRKYGNAARNWKNQAEGKEDWQFSTKKTADGIRMYRIK